MCLKELQGRKVAAEVVVRRFGHQGFGQTDWVGFVQKLEIFEREVHAGRGGFTSTEKQLTV